MHLAAARASGTVGLPTSTLNLVEGVLKAVALDGLTLGRGHRAPHRDHLHRGGGPDRPAGRARSRRGEGRGGKRQESPTAPAAGPNSEDPRPRLRPLEPLLGDWDVGRPGDPIMSFRAVFQWKGGGSCMAYRTFEKHGDDWFVIGTGLIFWDPANAASPENDFRGIHRPLPGRILEARRRSPRRRVHRSWGGWASTEDALRHPLRRPGHHADVRRSQFRFQAHTRTSRRRSTRSVAILTHFACIAWIRREIHAEARAVRIGSFLAGCCPGGSRL